MATDIQSISQIYYDDAPVGLVSFKSDGIIIDCNNTFTLLTNFEKNEIVELKNFRDFMTMGGKIFFDSHLYPLLNLTGRVNEINMEWMKKDGSKIPVLINAINKSHSTIPSDFIYASVIEIGNRHLYEKEIIKSKKKLEELNVSLLKSNKEINHKTQLIERQNKELEKLNRSKNKFFTIVAHDLRSPLASLRNYTDLIVSKYASEVSREVFIEMGQNLHSLVENAIKMTDNLLAWARIQMNNIEIKPDYFDMHGLINETVEIYQKIALMKSISIKVESFKTVNAFADRDQVNFVVRNLVNNAIKFTKPHGEINISILDTDPKFIRVAVSDTGIGMTQQEIDKLFSIEKTSSKVGTTGELGTGIGLSLCHDFILKNNGTISVKSTKGKGSVFELLIPKSNSESQKYVE